MNQEITKEVLCQGLKLAAEQAREQAQHYENAAEAWDALYALLGCDEPIPEEVPIPGQSRR